MTPPQLVLHCIPDGQVEYYKPLQKDETVASWAKRQPGVHLHSDLEDEDTFGPLAIDLPGCPRTLKRQLRRAAQPPDPWLLRPYQRTLVCPRCIAEDWAQGVPAYDRRAWCVAWRTCCPRHGLLFDTDNRNTAPNWLQLLDKPRWTGDRLFTIHKRTREALLNLSLGADRRAIHLETALGAKRRGAWFPGGMTPSTLRAIYREIVSDLLSELLFSDNGPEDQQPNPGFNRALNANRFVVNVLAEAILSEWTQTPLPSCALARRTSLLVRAIGWGEANPPYVRAGQLLVQGPIMRKRSLVRYVALLRPQDYARLSQPTVDYRVPCLTLPEARLLGLRHPEALSVLARMTMRGQFLAFDARRGRLVENRYLPVQVRLNPEEVPAGVILPAWAMRPRVDMSVPAWDLLCDVFGQAPPEVLQRWAARERRWRREEQRTVRFGLVIRRKGANRFSEKHEQAPPN
jgi:hypothetical protein